MTPIAFNRVLRSDHFGKECPSVLSQWPDNFVDAVVTDPPYELGFMGRAWDATGIAYSIDFWREILRVMKPGAYLLSFGGTRTYHRMACAIEDAGFEIRDQLQWLYGSGFPKSLDVSKAIDKAVGAVRETGPVDPSRAGRLVNQKGSYTTDAGWSAGNRKVTIDPPATEDAKKWNGWGTALKPANEPIVLARKPLSEKTVVENVLRWGTGALNIEISRIPCDDKTPFPEGAISEEHVGKSYGGKPKPADSNPTGRWPANVVHDGSDEVVSLFPDAPGQMARAKADGEQKGNKVFGTMKNGTKNPAVRQDSSSSASRFFYCAKAKSSERGDDNNHPTVKPIALIQHLVGMVLPPGGVVLDPFLGSGTLGVVATSMGALWLGLEKEQHYIDIAEKRIFAARKEDLGDLL